MRDLTSKKNMQNITDAIGGQVVQMYYRLPTTEERFGFTKACLEQDGDEVKYNPGPARLEYGLKVLTGFREGDFGADGKPISSDPKSKAYRKDWKKLLGQTSADLVMALALAVFEGARLLGPGDPKKEGADLPLSTSSGD